MPQVGDAEDGRLHVLTGYGSTTPQDPRHLFGPAAVMFARPDWRARGGPAGDWEASWWGLDANAVPLPAPAAVTPAAWLFPHAGIAVARAGDGHYLLVTNGIVGTNGFGNHKHNDQLSFEWHHGGTPLIVDPGSYVYTSDPEARNRFRSTAAHNTLSVDETEQNDLRPDWLFRMFETSNAETVSFDDRDGVMQYVGRHHGYERLADPVTHERTFRFVIRTGEFSFTDRVIGRGRHRLRWRLQIAPGVSVDHGPAAGAIVLSTPARQWTIRVPPALAVSIEPSAYSPSYGVQVASTVVTLSTDVTLDGDMSWAFGTAS
jgi:uncharacterized heparinase superfamily protein